MRGIAVTKAFSNTRSSGMMEISRSTRKMRSSRPSSAASLSSTGIRLATTMMKSKTFQALLKKRFRLCSAIMRMLISSRKNRVMPISRIAKTLLRVGGMA